MSRVDVPTLKCDRCEATTQDRDEMYRYQTVVHQPSADVKPNRWDLCPDCWVLFQGFIHGVDVVL